MKDDNKIQKTAVKIAEGIKKYINNKINEVKGKISRDQDECESKAKGMSLNEIKTELQCILYSNQPGRFLISFCEYIMYSLAGIEIITFLGRNSTDYKIVNLCFEAGILEVFIAAIIGIICFIKNKQMPILIYTIAATVTYFLRMTEHSLYNVLNLGLLALMLIIDIYFIRKFIKSDETAGSMFKNNKGYEKETHTEIMIRCPKCGNICSREDKFCVECGENLDTKRNSYKNTTKSEDRKASRTTKKSSKVSDDDFEIDKTQYIDRTVIMDNIEEKIIKHTDDQYKYN